MKSSFTAIVFGLCHAASSQAQDWERQAAAQAVEAILEAQQRHEVQAHADAQQARKDAVLLRLFRGRVRRCVGLLRLSGILRSACIPAQRLSIKENQSESQ